MQEVLSRYEFLNKKHTAYVQEHEHERAHSTSSIEREKQLMASVDRLQHLLVSHYVASRSCAALLTSFLESRSLYSCPY